MSTEASLYGLQGDYEDLYGLNAGLNKGIKVGRFLKKASKQISLKNAIKVAPMLAVGAVTGGAGGVGMAVLKKGALKMAGKALIKKVGTGAGRKLLVKGVGGKILSKFASKKQQNAEPVGELTPVAPVYEQPAPVEQVLQQPIYEQTEPVAMPLQNGAMVNNAVAYSEKETPVGALEPVQQVPKSMDTLSTPVAPVKDKTKTMMYVGGAVILAGLVYLVTRKKETK